MDVGAGFLCMYEYDVVVKKFTFAISSPDEFLCIKVIDTVFVKQVRLESN